MPLGSASVCTCVSVCSQWRGCHFKISPIHLEGRILICPHLLGDTQRGPHQSSNYSCVMCCVFQEGASLSEIAPCLSERLKTSRYKSRWSNGSSPCGLHILLVYLQPWMPPLCRQPHLTHFQPLWISFDGSCPLISFLLHSVLILKSLLTQNAVKSFPLTFCLYCHTHPIVNQVSST